MDYRNDATTSHRIDVAIDGSFLKLPASGIGTYVRGLSQALIAEQESLGLRVRMIEPRNGTVLKPGHKAHRFVWDTLGVTNEMLANGRPDVMHLPQMSAPIASFAPMVVTIHDAIPFVIDEYRASKAMNLYLSIMARTARRAKRIITPSLAAADDVARVLHVPRDRIVAIPEGADPSLEPATDGSARRYIKQKWGITGPYVFNIAGFDRRKQVPLLVRAFADALPNLPDDAQLVIGGNAHSSNDMIYPPVEPVIAEHGLENRVILTGWVTDDERRMLYQAARVYATPSLYEGFGLTPLEAMYCGIPSIVANRTSLPEVVGDAGVVAEPTVEDFAGAIVQMMTDDALHEALALRSLKRATGFTWSRAAYITSEIYHAVARRQ